MCVSVLLLAFSSAGLGTSITRTRGWLWSMASWRSAGTGIWRRRAACVPVWSRPLSFLSRVFGFRWRWCKGLLRETPSASTQLTPCHFGTGCASSTSGDRTTDQLLTDLLYCSASRDIFSRRTWKLTRKTPLQLRTFWPNTCPVGSFFPVFCLFGLRRRFIAE